MERNLMTMNGTVREAEHACKALAVALERAGLRLPSLQVETAAYADQLPRPLIDLGRCPPGLARDLAALIEAGARVER